MKSKITSSLPGKNTKGITVVLGQKGSECFVYDGVGRDITRTLRLKSIKIDAAVASVTVATFECMLDRLEAKPGQIVVYAEHPLTGKQSRLRKMVFEDGTLLDFDGLHQL